MNEVARGSQEDLSRARVRLIEARERDEWNRLMLAYHTWDFKTLIGHSLRYITESQGQACLARLGLSGDAASVGLIKARRMRTVQCHLAVGVHLSIAPSVETLPKNGPPSRFWRPTSLTGLASGIR